MLEVVNEVDFCLWIVTRKWSNNIAEYSCNSQVQIPSDILAFVFLTILLSLILCVNAHGGSLLEFFNKIDFCLWIVTRKQSNNALWAEGGWKLKLIKAHATEYGIQVTKYLLV